MTIQRVFSIVFVNTAALSHAEPTSFLIVLRGTTKGTFYIMGNSQYLKEQVTCRP
jgi:hypothetical protein